MGQKVNPNGLRLGINKDWEAKWYSNKTDFAKYLDRDVKIREYLEKNGVSASTAEEDACRMEHLLSDETFQMMKKFLKK